jgi:23S rRNA A2030 N6-methylase RlmJ
MENQYFEISRSLKNKKAKIIVGDKVYNPLTKRSRTRRHIVYIEPCYESYQQYGAVQSVLSFTLPIAEELVRNGFRCF